MLITADPRTTLYTASRTLEGVAATGLDDHREADESVLTLIQVSVDAGQAVRGLQGLKDHASGFEVRRIGQAVELALEGVRELDTGIDHLLERTAPLERVREHVRDASGRFRAASAALGWE